jgi:hypothetical protein
LQHDSLLVVKPVRPTAAAYSYHKDASQVLSSFVSGKSKYLWDYYQHLTAPMTALLPSITLSPDL